MAESQVKIQLTAEDKASQVFKSHAATLAHAQKSYESLTDYMKRTAREAQNTSDAQQKAADATKNSGDAADGASNSWSGLFKSITLGTIAANLLQKAVQMVTDTVKDAIQEAANYERSLMGLNSAGAAFGYTTDQMNTAIKQVTNDGLLGFSTAANTLKTLLSTGMDIDTATMLIQRFKDEAAFGRKGTIDYGQAVENLSQAYRAQNSTLGDASGHQQNFSEALEIGAQALGKTVGQLTEAEREQAKLIGYMQQGAHTAGDAAAYTETYAGALARMEAEAEKASVSLGQSLLPASQYVTESFTSFMQSMTGTANGAQDLQAYLVTLAAVVRTVAQSVVAAGQVMWGALNAVATLSWDPLIQGIDAAGEGMVDVWGDAWKQFENIYTDGNAGAADSQQKALDRMTAANGAAQSKIQQQVGDTTRAFHRQMESRTKSFNESLRDMIISHRDKSRSIQADIAKEQAAYDAANLKRKQSYEEDLASLEERHLEKVQDIEAQISEEREKGLVVDGVLYQTANEKKIAKLEEQLRKETETHQMSVDKRKSQYAEDVSADQERHNEKMTQLQQALNAELEILNKHRADVARVGDAKKEDDIARLKRTFSEQNAEATRNHNEQLAKIGSQGAAQGATYGGAYTNSATAELEKLKAEHQKKMEELKNQAGKSGTDSAKSMWENFKSGISQWFSQLPTHIGNLFKDIDKHTGAITGIGTLMGFIPGASGASQLFKQLTGRATGGTVRPGEVTLVGERGPEIAQFPAGTRIIPTDQSRQMLSEMGGQSRQTTVSIGTVINQSNMDADAFLSGLSWYLR